MDQPAERAPSIPPLEFYRLIRSQIEHEDNLNAQRLSWFVASQSFLFTAYAIVISNLQPGKPSWVERQQRLLTLLIPGAAVVTSLLIYVTIVAGSAAIRNLRREYERWQSPADLKALPLVQGYRLTQLFGQAGPLFLPPTFIALWVVLVMRGLSA